MRLTVGLALSQHVSGLGITLLATALSYYGYRVSFPKVDTPPTITPFAPMDWLPMPVLNAQTAADAAGPAAGAAAGWVLYRTPLGLAVRMVGENPQACRRPGPVVAGLRTGAIVAGSALMGVAGASSRCRPSTPSSSTWSTAAAGSAWRWWCLLSWRPGKALLGALLFAFFDALQLRLQQAGVARWGWSCPTSCT
jgi:ABC-type uncharacterized transport system permease subunit